MQVVLLSQIAREKGLFDITDVIKGISENGQVYSSILTIQTKSL